MAGKSSPLLLWLLTDGAPGHLSQSRGLADAIGRFCPVEVTKIELRVRNRLLKSLGRFLQPHIGDFSSWLRRQVYSLELPLMRPDLLISSGGNTLLASALLARELQVPNLYSGTLKGYAPESYSLIFTVNPLGLSNNRVLPLPPVPGSLARPLQAPGTNAPWLLLIGGDGAGYRYRKQDWQGLAEAVNRLGVQGVRWLLTTSRRTGREAESFLQRHLISEFLLETVYYGDNPRPVVREFLERCERVWVTEDSLTMVAEAIYAGRPVSSLRPRQVDPEDNDARALERYAERGLLRRLEILALEDQALASIGRKRQVVPDVQQLIWDAVKPLLPPERLP